MRHTTSHLMPALLAAAVFAGLAVVVLNDEMISAVDLALSDGVQALRSPASDWIVVLVTLFGDATALTLIAITIVFTLLLRRAWWAAGMSALAFVTTPLIVKAIKVFVGRERPMADLYSGVESFSFPSGHMTNSTVIYGALAILAAHALTGAWKRLVIGGLILLIVLIGISRVYLGAHWPTDVIGAVLLASVMLFLVEFGFHQLPGEGRFARPFALVMVVVVAVWTVYSALTLGVALDKYAVDVTPDGTIDLETAPGRN
ncbi:phosphatase PAP2 family protein [Henriciella litoralis]|uniref:phosphatase PAP2 family protein n=1 Tax=Henriciella litoralis TaxID=568102 RepID=UPI0009FDA328|nr:phosphatase PAP2 family protein [Henriciella litoralis]